MLLEKQKQKVKKINMRGMKEGKENDFGQALKRFDSYNKSIKYEEVSIKQVSLIPYT